MPNWATITLCLETRSDGSNKILKSLICNNLATFFIFTFFFNRLKSTTLNGRIFNFYLKNGIFLKGKKIFVTVIEN